MTESTDATVPATEAPKKRGGGLNSLLLADLKAMAGQLGIKGAGSMKKAQLVEAIKAAQSGGSAGGGAAQGGADAGRTTAAAESGDGSVKVTQRTRRRSNRGEGQAEAPSDRAGDQRGDRAESGEQQPSGPQATEAGNRGQQDRGQQGQDKHDRGSQDTLKHDAGSKQDQGSKQDRNRQQKQDGHKQDQQGKQDGRKSDNQRQQGGGQSQQKQDGHKQDGHKQDQGESDQEESGRSRRRRGRDRDRSGRQRNEPDTTILEDDVLVPAAGILDVLENYAFVRTSGYTSGAEDVYLSLSMVRKYGLRRGDAVVGQVRQPREGERREKFNPMVRIDAVNGADPETAADRVEFNALTPVHPTERLRLETSSDNVTGRVLDLAAPLGKGQRGLLVGPTRTGRTTLLQKIAASISENNPECHLMVVLLDERPEEVTDFQRSVRGEVIASTFDKPATDHTMVAELAIERAKRLVELGHDVVVLMDGITRLARAYNLATATGGRSLRGGVDAATMHPTKQFFGAARNIEDGGSLTILATALIGSGSETDEVIFDEFRSAENWEVRLSAELAAAGTFPAIEVHASGTRREELLVGEQEHTILGALRRTLDEGDPAAAQKELVDRVARTKTNIELLTQLQK